MTCLHGRVDRVASRSGELADDRPRLADDRIEERRLARVRPSDDDDRDLIALRLSPASPSVLSGSSATSSSSRSPVPIPCKAEIAIGSPNPSRYSSGAITCFEGSSSLLAATTTGAGARRSTSAISKSPASGPARPSTMNTTASAPSIAVAIWARTPSPISDRSPLSKPPVSISARSRPAQSVRISLRSLVTPGVSSTTAAREPLRRFTRVDLPALGLPTTTIVA